jgi:hypothetical protein
MSYLGRHAGSRLFFIFPKANEGLRKSGKTIESIASQSLGQRVTILYLEDLLERMLGVTKDDPALQQHFQEFKKKYVLPEAA